MTTPAPHDADRVPACVAYGGVAVVGGTALAVLAYYQHTLGIRAHMPWVLSWSFSIGLDVGSAVAGIFWFFGGGKVRSWGRTFSIALVLTSTALTCVAWGLETGWWWAPLGAIHPAVVFGMAKLLTVWQAARAVARTVRDALTEDLTAARAEAARAWAELTREREEAAAREREALAVTAALTAERDAAAARLTALAVERDSAAEREREAAAREREARAAAEELAAERDAAREREHAAPVSAPSRPPAGPASAAAAGMSKRERIDALIFQAWARGEEPNCSQIDRDTDSSAAARGRKAALTRQGWGPGHVPEGHRAPRRLAPAS